MSGLELIGPMVSLTKLVMDVIKSNGGGRGGGRGAGSVQEVARAVRDPRCLFDAVRRGDAALVQGLLDLGAAEHLDCGHTVRLHKLGFLAMGDYEVVRFTPLMCAAMCDNAAMVHLLCDWGAELEDECCTREGIKRTALVLAVLYNKLHAARALLEEGADATSYRTTPKRKTLAAHARSEGNNRMYHLLREYE